MGFVNRDDERSRLLVPDDAPAHVAIALERRSPASYSGWGTRPWRRRAAANRATELFVTIKTVEAHLSHAYRKLEISSRAQLDTALLTPAPTRARSPSSKSSPDARSEAG